MLGKGIAFAVIGAAIGAVVWVLLIRATGLSLWILAPIVGGAAGFGMMRGTKMRGGMSEGILAATATLVAIFAARYFVISGEVHSALAWDETEVIDEIAYEVADEWFVSGYEIFDEVEGDFLPAVYEEAEQRWYLMSEADQQAYLAALEGDTEVVATVLTPIALVFDFGIFGSFCAFLAIGCAYKTSSITLEQALVQEGHATDADQAQAMATDLRRNDTGLFGRLGGTSEPPAPGIASGSPLPSAPAPDGMDRSDAA